MNNLQSTLIIEQQSHTALYLVDIKCKSCEAITRAADIVFGTDNDIRTEHIFNDSYYCKGCNTTQPYTEKSIVRTNRAGKIADHIIEAFPHTDNKPLQTKLWINTHTNKMLFVCESMPTFHNVQNKLFIPLADNNDFIELRYQLNYELDKDSNVPAVVQRILKQWGALHPFLLLSDEIERPGALFDVCQLTIEKTPSELTAQRTFIGPRMNKRAYFLDSQHINLLTDPYVFNESIHITLNRVCEMVFHGDKRLLLYVVKKAPANYSWLEGKYIEAKWDKKNNICTPLAILSERPSFIME